MILFQAFTSELMTTRREFLSQTIAAGVAAAYRIPRSAEPPAGNDNPKTTGVVESIFGPLPVSKLGFTLSHEHVCFIPHDSFPDRKVAAIRMVEKLTEAKAAGVDTIIDLTPADAWRDIRFGEEVARKSGMQVVAATGFRFAPETYNTQSVEQIAEVFIREIENGIEDTNIKAGVIKAAAVSATITRAEEKGFKAVARASKATGVPIETHTDSHRHGGEMQADLLEAEGISPTRVSLGHCDDTDDVNYLLGLAKRGYTLGIDHVFWGAVKSKPGQPDFFKTLLAVPWQKRATYVKQLIDAGYGDRIFSPTTGNSSGKKSIRTGSYSTHAKPFPT